MASVELRAEKVVRPVQIPGVVQMAVYIRLAVTHRALRPLRRPVGKRANPGGQRQLPAPYQALHLDACVPGGDHPPVLCVHQEPYGGCLEKGVSPRGEHFVVPGKERVPRRTRPGAQQYVLVAARHPPYFYRHAGHNPQNSPVQRGLGPRAQLPRVGRGGALEKACQYAGAQMTPHVRVRRQKP